VITRQIRRTLALFCFFSVAAFAQTAHKSTSKSSPAENKLATIHVTGTQRYTPGEIIAATGLEVGSVATHEDFQKAGQKLGECGLFSNVSYSYAYTPTGTKLDLELVDSDKLVPVRFENFVWFSNDELLARIHERLPLFKGQVPIGGNLADQISDVLQALLVQHSLSARADYIRDSKEPGGPIDAISFRASGVTLDIREVRFDGAGTDELPLLAATASKLEGKDYSRSDVVAFAALNLLPIYQARGYLKAEISEPQVKVAGETADSTEVSVLFSVKPGPQYKISSIDWKGNKAFPAEKLQNLLHAQTGQIANGPQLKTDLEAVQHLYGTVGYMAASVKPEPRLDDGSSTVAYELEVHEGDVFHLGDLDFQGVDPKTVDRLREAWTLRETDPYDTSYPRRFFEQTVKLLSHDVTWTVSIHEGVNESDKTVDVTLRYGIRPSS
jgi:outer membrane protein assembly factor BamA